MKKFFVSLYLVFSFILGIELAFALDYTSITSNPKVISALDALISINRRDVVAILYGQNKTRKPMRVLFRDLAVYGCSDCEALTTPTKSGGLVVYLNNEHRGARAECIACLLAHESQHHTFTNTAAEELRAWVSETQAWNEFVKRNPSLATSTEPLAKRENYIAKIRSKNGVQGIQKLIAANPVYAGLN